MFYDAPLAAGEVKARHLLDGVLPFITLTSIKDCSQAGVDNSQSASVNRRYSFDRLEVCHEQATLAGLA